MLRLVVLLFAVVFSFPAVAGERLLVFAAASQKEAMEKIGELYEIRCECDVVFSFAATSTLARQIDAGAKADVFISANEAWADWLEIRGSLIAETRAVIAGNRLVIATAKKDNSGPGILSEGRFAMADPVSVPAGIYAREALENLGLWPAIRSNAVFAENVRVALSAVKRGDLVAGIVYQSDLELVPELKAQYLFPETSHRPIHYVGGTIVGSRSGADFVNFLLSAEAQDVFERFGFLRVSVTNQG